MSSKRRVTLIFFVLFILLLVVIWWYSKQPKASEEQLEYIILAENLNVPWSLAIAPNGDIFFTERNGNVKLLKGEKVETIHTIEVDHQQNRESGLLGITTNPNFLVDPKIYLYYTYQDENELIWNRVSSFTYLDTRLENEKILLDKIPGGNIHDGGRIKFGPDGKLYITTGEAGVGKLAQDPNSLAGKILRINDDGTVPVDNPFENSPVYSLGHRNPQGLAWHPETDKLYITEHGPSGEGFRFAHDEINIIEPGANYGWPEIIGESNNQNYEDPVYHTGDVTWAPSGCTFLDDPSSSWHERLFVANLRGTSIRMIKFTSPEYKEIEVNTPLFQDLGRIRTVVQGPDGYLYFCTSNRDGRGTPNSNDDIIAKFKPPSLN